MQQRRFRPGDVLDDYCPRERRVTDHAIVAMIDDNIKQTRCVACDVEHEYKQAKVPPQRKKKTPALYTQVLEGLQAPTRKPHLPDVHDDEPVRIHDEETDVEGVTAVVVAAAVVTVAPVVSTNNGNGSGNTTSDARAAVAPEPQKDDDAQPQQGVVDGPFRRQLIRAALPRPEGTPPPVRAIPEFTIRQPSGRANRPGHGAGRRRGQPQAQGQGQNGPARFGRSANGQRSNGHGRPGGHGGSGGQGNHGNHAGSGGAHGSRSGGPRRGGKKR
jgi:hypothetical protein